MPTKKQARAKQKRRHEQLEAKLAARQARRLRRQRIASAITAGALVLGGGTIVAMTMTSPADNPSPSPSPSTPAFGPPPGYSEGREWAGTIELDQGTLGLTLDGVNAPTATDSFVYLAQQGYFDGTSCHRLITEGIYILQCGSPDGTGTDGPGYSFGPVENAPVDNLYPAGTVAMARVQNDGYSMGSQFFIVYKDSTIPSDLAGGYTVFGTVTDGLGIVEAIAAAGTETGSSVPAEPVILREVSVS